jgi:hypothetical protein
LSNLQETDDAPRRGSAAGKSKAKRSIPKRRGKKSKVIVKLEDENHDQSDTMSGIDIKVAIVNVIVLVKTLIANANQYLQGQT